MCVPLVNAVNAVLFSILAPLQLSRAAFPSFLMGPQVSPTLLVATASSFCPKGSLPPSRGFPLGSSVVRQLLSWYTCRCPHCPQKASVCVTLFAATGHHPAAFGTAVETASAIVACSHAGAVGEVQTPRVHGATVMGAARELRATRRAVARGLRGARTFAQQPGRAAGASLPAAVDQAVVVGSCISGVSGGGGKGEPKLAVTTFAAPTSAAGYKKEAAHRRARPTRCRRSAAAVRTRQTVPTLRGGATNATQAQRPLEATAEAAPKSIYTAQKTAEVRLLNAMACSSARKEYRTEGGDMASAPATGGPLIGTHSGTFHADEVLATVMLLSLPEYKDAKLLRSRDPAALAACDIVVDVGAEYSTAALRFDHHQNSFTTTFYDDEEKQSEIAGLKASISTASPTATRGAEERRNRPTEAEGKGSGEKQSTALTGEKCEEGRGARDGKPKAVTKLSSAGLIYKHFGKRMLRHKYGIDDESTLETVYKRLYPSFFEAIDAIDNGVSVVPGGGPLLYKDGTNLSSRIAQCNPPWNAELLRQKYPDNRMYHPEKGPLYPVDIQGGDPEGNVGFRKAMLLAGEALDAAARGVVDVWLPARDIVAQAVKERYNVHPSGRMIKLKQWCPFEEHVFILEKELIVQPPLLYCLYPDLQGGKERGWRIRAIGIEGHMMESRLPLASCFRGLRSSELGSVVCNACEGDSAYNNITPDAFIHCHATGFTAGTNTLDAAVALGALSIRMAALTESATP